MIELKGVNKSYGSQTVLRGVNLSIKKGSFISIMGPSGSGKSTLLNIIGGMEKADSGVVIVNNNEISLFDEEKLTYFRRENIGFIFQFFNLFTHLTVYENILIPLLISNRKVEDEKIDEYLKMLGIFNKKESLSFQLSGGEQQRVAIARALIKNPAILLADEPTGSLDSETGENILSILKDINKRFETTILLVTHDANVAKIADINIKIKDGKIIT
jgi:putative ABC transport system ATP-binding protein